MKINKPTRSFVMLSLLGFVILGGTTIYYAKSPSVKPVDTPSIEKEKPDEKVVKIPGISGISGIVGCQDGSGEGEDVFTIQAYRGGAYANDSNWLQVHFKSAFTQGEGACGSNSLSTALYGQKNMINRFIQELGQLDKSGSNRNYDYVRKAGQELHAEAQSRNMVQGQRLDCYGGEVRGMLCRKLTQIDGLEAFFPEIVAQVKAWANKGYAAKDIYINDNSGLTNGLEFIDGTINLSIPLDHPERGIAWWKQEYFKEFVQKKFDSYTAQIYLSPLAGDRYGDIKASTNPILANGKTMYVAYKERLLTDKKLTPYVSNLERMHGSASPIATQPVTTPGNNGSTTNPDQIISYPSVGGARSGDTVPLKPVVTVPQNNMLYQNPYNYNVVASPSQYPVIQKEKSTTSSPRYIY